MNLLFFTGQRVSGKTLASTIVQEFDTRFKEVNFADIPKKEYAELIGIDVKEMNIQGIKEKHRWAFIEFCDQKKKEDPLCFIKAAFKDLNEDGHYVFGDLRSIEELQEAHNRAGVVYRVYASNEIRKERGWNPNPIVDNHSSETDLALSAYTLFTLTGGGWVWNNTNDKNQLKGEIWRVLSRHFPV